MSTNLNEEHIINQRLKDEKLETKKNYFEEVNKIYNDYLNTLNNETKEYLNMEDERVGSDNKFIKTNEVGLYIEKDPLLRIGACEREVFFKINGISAEGRNFKEIESIEKDELIKQQWLRKLKLAKVITDVEQGMLKEVGGIVLKSTIDCFIHNFKRNSPVGLLIKPVNDTAQAIRKQLWNDDPKIKSEPLKVHLPEVMALIVFYKIPIKILYVGKNNSELIKDFTFTIKEGCLVIDGEKKENLPLTGISESLGILKKAITEKISPPRAFVKPKVLSALEIGKLVKEKMISRFEADKLAKSEIYEPYQCNYCRYKELCNSLGEGFIKHNVFDERS